MSAESINRIVRRRLICIGVALQLIMMGCSTPSSTGSKEIGFASGQSQQGKITEAQLQDSLFRFANRFASKINDGTSYLERSPEPNIRAQALLRRLLYNSAALDIVLGPSPQANLLDMVAFVQLSRAVWNDYWVPKVFHDQGTQMTRDFKEVSDQIWNIAATVMNENQRKELASLIQLWREKNPDQISVENVRFSEFSKEAGARAQEMKNEVGGLLASIQGATQTGDRALLFSERALFYVQRAPFLWRLQAQAGTRDVLSEAMTTLKSSREILNQEPRIHALLGDMDQTLASLTQSIDSAAKHPNILTLGASTITQLAEVLKEWNRTLSSPQFKASLAQIPALSAFVDRSANRFLWKLFGLGVALILFFGLISLGSRLAFLWLTRRMIRTRRSKAAVKETRKAA